jgi:WD40 repeat protein
MNSKILSNTSFPGHRGAIYKLFFQPDSDFLYSAGGDGWIVRWDPLHSEEGFLLAKDEDSILTASFPEKDRIFAGTLQGNLLDISLADPTSLPRKWKAHKKGVFAMEVSRNVLFTGGGDGMITQWRPGDLAVTHSVKVSNGNVRSILADEKWSRIWVGTSSGNLIVMDMETLSITQSIPAAHERSVFSLALSERFIISGGMDAQIRFWDRETGEMHHSISAHWFTVNDILVDNERSLLISASRDKTCRIWSLENFSLIATIRVHSHSVNALCWGPGKESFFSAGDDRTIFMHFLERYLK